MIDRRRLLQGAMVASALPAAAMAQPGPWPPPNGIPLWLQGIPDRGARLPRPDLQRHGIPGREELQLRGVAEPMLYPFRPARSNGVALLVLPGGGYEFLAVTNEGLSVAEAFRAMGYTPFVLTYRLPAEGWRNSADVPLQDAQRAIRLIRARAADYSIDPARVGVLGFSAGGHLAASLATAYGERVYAPVDAADRLPARPAIAGLLYAVTTLRLPTTHRGSRDHLLGPDPSAATVDRRSPVLHVDQATPPTFLLHALDDTIVPPQCSLDWLAACRERNVPVEAHFPQIGGHGFGVGLPPTDPAALWPQLFDRWLADRYRSAAGPAR